MGWNGDARKRYHRDDKGPLILRYVCSSCSSFRGWYAARQLERRWVVSSTRMEEVDGSWGLALIYWSNRSLFLSRRPSRPPHFDRYRLVIAFRYLNISVRQNLLDELAGCLLRAVVSLTWLYVQLSRCIRVLKDWQKNNIIRKDCIFDKKVSNW